MKKILIHDTVLYPQNQRGVNRVFINYTHAILEKYADYTYIYSKNNRNFSCGKRLFSVKDYKYPFIKKINNKMNEFGIRLLIKKDNIYFSPYYGNMHNQNIKKIYLAHDMIYENYFSKAAGTDIGVIKFIEEKKKCFENAHVIVCVSHYTRQDIMQIYPKIPPLKYKVIHNGIEDFFFTNKPSKYTGKPYLLFVGHRTDYKNFEMLLTSYGKSGLKNGVNLVAISPTDYPLSNYEKMIVEKYKLGNNFILKSNISDFELANYYTNAHAFVFPSQCEGFGLPILEAMACGTIVLSSNRTSMPEIGGNVPYYFDPYSIDELVESLRRIILLSDEERKLKINMGKQHASKYSWENSKKKFLEIIDSNF